MLAHALQLIDAHARASVQQMLLSGFRHFRRNHAQS
jgi:hypothetical protein